LSLWQQPLQHLKNQQDLDADAQPKLATVRERFQPVDVPLRHATARERLQQTYRDADVLLKPVTARERP